jgi:hypothetical protein
VFRIIRDAAGIDAEAATLDRDRDRAAPRLRNYEIAAQLLDQRGALRDGLTIDQAAATIFAIGHPETYRTLVLDGSWGCCRACADCATPRPAPLECPALVLYARSGLGSMKSRITATRSWYEPMNPRNVRTVAP